MAQDITDPISHIQWKKVVLNNYATFKNFNDLSWGSGFLLNYNNDVIACTARDLTGTIYSHGDRIMVNDFDEELNYWKMYVPDDPTQYVIMDTLIMKKRIEKSFLGIVNRAYRLKKNKRGKIINEDKVSEGSYYEYFVNGTEMRLILGKDYGKK